MRQPPPEQWLSSQRATAEFREVEARVAELQRQLAQRNRELGNALAQRNSAAQRVVELEAQQPPVLNGRRSEIGKLKKQSTAFYDQVHFLVRCLKRYEDGDVGPLVATA